MTIVFKVSENVKQKMITYYKDLRKEKTPPYAVFQAVEADTVITLYESGKAMFQGISADIDANIWIDLEKKLNHRDVMAEQKDKKDKKTEHFTFVNVNSIGSDEVGTGDYFGPIVVTATYVSKEDISFLSDLGVRDSKKLTDEKILKIAPDIIKRIPYVSYILNNASYNDHYHADINMNKVKAILHNKVLVSLAEKDYPYEKIVVDQFVYPKKYYEHIATATKKATNITFMTKAEDQCLSVAAASIICRYIFLKEMDKLSARVGRTLPKGAGTLVDEVGKELVQKFGESILHDIAKLNFKNTQKIKDLL